MILGWSGDHFGRVWDHFGWVGGWGGVAFKGLLGSFRAFLRGRGAAKGPRGRRGAAAGIYIYIYIIYNINIIYNII